VQYSLNGEFRQYIDVSRCIPGAHIAELLSRDADRLEGLSALPLSAQSGHIVHQIEALLQLLEDAPCAGNGTLPHVLRRVERLLFPLLSSAQANDWVRSVVSLTLQYRQDHHSQDCALITPRVYLREHMFPQAEPVDSSAFYILKPRRNNASLERPIPVEDLEGAVCYKDLVLLGRTNTHVKFFPAENTANKFRRYVYDRTGVEIVESRDGGSAEGAQNAQDDTEQPLYCPQSSTNCTLHVFTDHQPQNTGGGHSHRRLRVTISVRTGGRYILNLPALMETMVGTGLVNARWLREHVVVLETLSFEEQVRIMAQTDVLLCVHGAAVINGIFMRPGSVVLELFNARFVEFVFAAPLREAGVRLLYTYPRNQARDTEHCPSTVPPHCVSPEISVFDAGSIDCVAIRTCSVRVDVSDFHLVFMEAYYHVLSAKWHAEPSNQRGDIRSNESVTPPVLGCEEIHHRIHSSRREYLQLVGERAYVGALAVAQKLQRIDQWQSHPVSLLELGVLHFSCGNYSTAVQYCRRSLVAAAEWPAAFNFTSVVTQAHVCVGVAGSHLQGNSMRDEVLSAFYTAWSTATSAEDSSFQIPPTDQCKDFSVTSSTMLAAPLESISFNLLRAHERYGLFGRGLHWFVEHLDLPDLHRGGAYVIALSSVKWSSHSKARIDELEAELRHAGQFVTAVHTTLWDEIVRVQSKAMHLISIAVLCLSKVAACGPDTNGTMLDCVQEGLAEQVWAMVYEVAMANVLDRDATVVGPAGQLQTEGAAAAVPAQCGVALITQYYRPLDPVKQQGLDIVLQRNLDSHYISEVYLLSEQEHDFSAFRNADKIYQFITNKRLTFREAFSFANQYLTNRTVAVGKVSRMLVCEPPCLTVLLLLHALAAANADIYFDSTLSRVAAFCPLTPVEDEGAPGARSTGALPSMHNRVFALLKWQADVSAEDAPPSITVRTDSQDAWIFQAPIKQEVLRSTDFYLGQPKCDNRLVRVLQQAGYQVSNPAFAVRAIEYPYHFEVPVYDAQQAVPGEVADLLLSDASELLYSE
jgi:hypothetical protein